MNTNIYILCNLYKIEENISYEHFIADAKYFIQRSR